MLTLLERNKTPFIIAHEFFDALPIHAFQSVVAPRKVKPDRSSPITSSPNDEATPFKKVTESFEPLHAWRELLISPTRPPSVINPPKTPGPEFELTVAPKPTHRSRVLPEVFPRYNKLLPIVGATFEISPEAQTITTDLTNLIAGTNNEAPNQTPSPASGAALMIDYGPSDTIPISTLRGVRAHEQVSPFSSPGLVDISADVDFGALVETALNSSTEIEVHGPVEQGTWLEAMGGRERCEMLLAKAAEAEKLGNDGAKEVEERLESGWKRLVERGPNGMGRLYKVMAIVPERRGRRPVGFGGGVA